jgi:hypothetical protein
MPLWWGIVVGRMQERWDGYGQRQPPSDVLALRSSDSPARSAIMRRRELPPLDCFAVHLYVSLYVTLDVNLYVRSSSEPSSYKPPSEVQRARLREALRPRNGGHSSLATSAVARRVTTLLTRGDFASSVACVDYPPLRVLVQQSPRPCSRLGHAAPPKAQLHPSSPGPITRRLSAGLDLRQQQAAVPLSHRPPDFAERHRQFSVYSTLDPPPVPGSDSRRSLLPQSLYPSRHAVSVDRFGWHRRPCSPRRPRQHFDQLDSPNHTQTYRQSPRYPALVTNSIRIHDGPRSCLHITHPPSA